MGVIPDLCFPLSPTSRALTAAGPAPAVHNLTFDVFSQGAPQAGGLRPVASASVLRRGHGTYGTCAAWEGKMGFETMGKMGKWEDAAWGLDG